MKARILLFPLLLFVSLVALTLNAQVPAFVPDSGLVAWYPFNGNADDGSGNANHGAVQGTLPASDRFGQNASAYYFPGTNEKIVCPNDTAITNGSLLTSNTFNSYIVYQSITPFLIGLNIDSIGFQRSFKGCLDDIGLWNRPLSPQEVVTLYQAPQQVPDSLLHLKAFLQAAWRTGDSLAPSLNSGGLLPSVQPYNVLPWSYTGTESVSPLPADMVDWVLVELRTATDTVIERRAAGLRTDGMLLDTNGLPGLRFTSPPGNYHIAIQHRNHLPVMTRDKVAIPGFMLYDFTDTTQLPLFGGCVITTTSGAEAMIAGDLNHDGILKYSGSANDRALVFQRILLETGSTSLTTTLNGYFPEDIRMDGTVKYSGLGNDPSMIIQNLITLKGSTIITTTYSGCAPIPYIILPPVQTFQQCGDTLTDMRDGKKYPTVPIGTQCWMAKNLNVGTMVNSVNTGSNHSDASNNAIIEKYCFNNDPGNCAIYGGLYDWNEAMGYVTTSGIQGICPTGWHIPTDAEWCTMTTFLDTSVNCIDFQLSGTDIGTQLKEAGTAHWNTGNTGTNSSGFTALGGGQRYYAGSFSYINTMGYFWTSSLSSSKIYRLLAAANTQISKVQFSRAMGFSLRCMADTLIPCTPQPDQANAGPDSLNIPSDSLYLYANTPSVGSGQWEVISGQGGALADSYSATSLFSGMPDSTYTLVWTISTPCGSTSDTVIIGFSGPVPFNCGDTLTDPRDGQQYPTVQIGTQCWMAKNLSIGTMVISISTGSNHSDVTNDSIIGKYCYNNDQASCSIYGGLYDWNEMMGYVTTAGVQGICPSGWHLPTDAEWCTLTTFLDATVNCNTYGGSGTDAGGQMKEAGVDHWDSPNTGATNSSGFTALGVGYRDGNGNFSLPRNDAIFWSSSEDNLQYGIGRNLSYTSADVVRSNILKSFGFSVRCLADTFEICTPQPDQANAGSDSLNIPSDSLYLYANTPAVGSGQWEVISGQGGALADSYSATSLFSGMPDSNYTLVWTISTPCGSTSDTVIIGFTGPVPFNCGDTLLDIRDGQMYATVLIGTQCWMAENLNIGTMVTSVFTGGTHSDVSNNGLIEKYCYNNDPAKCAVYGGLYDWNEAMGYLTTPGAQGICPDGWHIPTDAELCVLTTSVDPTVDCNAWGSWSGIDAGGKLKMTGLDHWYTPNQGATNSSGFSAPGCGLRDDDGGFFDLQFSFFPWSSSTNTTVSSSGIMRQLSYYYAGVYRYSYDKSFGFSIRCLKD